MVAAGTPEKTAMMLSGSQTRRTFDRYDIVTGDNLANAIERVSDTSQLSLIL
jgi:hypothetical protein